MGRVEGDRRFGASAVPGAVSVVTPEGVLLEFRPTGIATRTIGRLVDLALMSVALMVSGLVLGLVALATPTWVVIAAWVVITFLILFGYPVAFEVFGAGRTLGHRATGTRVIRTDGGPVRFRNAAIRAMMFLVDGPVTAGFGGVVSILVSSRSQRLGDQAAGTMVVKLADKSLVQAGPAIIPAGYEEVAAQIDLARLTKADVLLAVELLRRGSEMREGAQSDLGSRVRNHIDARLGGVWRPGMRIDPFLRTVIGVWAQSGGNRIDTFSVRGRSRAEARPRRTLATDTGSSAPAVVGGFTAPG
ncbi:MAG: RDD family protein [Actinomycetia bacterium]|nr:RDD family protein [Actinomycetes bacterium]MCP4959440.1 RDD family protein [Actinomycetes bacterium]